MILNINLTEYKDDTMLLALSGGVDSMVLFHYLRTNNHKFQVVHINHQARTQSEDEYQYINKLCSDNDIKLHYKKLDLKGSNFQSRARSERYKYFIDICKSENIPVILTAHHLDDSLETSLIKYTNSYNLNSIAGISDIVSDGIKIVRPLINDSKIDIRKYQEQYDITYFEDHTNSENKYLRNRYRNTIIPLLKMENPSLLENHQINKTLLTEINDHLDLEAMKYIDSNTVKIQDFNILSTSIKRRILCILTKYHISFNQQNDVIKMCLNNSPNISIDIKNNHKVVREYDLLYVKDVEEVSQTNDSVEISKPGQYFVLNRKIIATFDLPTEKYIKLCYNENSTRLTVRTRKNGDKIKFSFGTKKIKDLFIDKKIPSSKRDQVLLVEQGDKIVGILDLNLYVKEDCKNYIYLYEECL